MNNFTRLLEEVIVEKTGDKKEYQAFFNKTLKSFGVDEPDELSDADKKEFFDKVDKGWKGDNESD